MGDDQGDNKNPPRTHESARGAAPTNAPSAVLINIQVFDKSMKIVMTCHDIVMTLLLSQRSLHSNNSQGCSCAALV
jgi:hypothetical protein